MPSVQKTTVAQRLWRRVQVGNPGGCWLWQGYIKPSGHGQLQRVKQGEGTVNAHIIAYELTHRKLPKGMVLHHKCRVKHCVNPNHLQLVSRQNHPKIHLQTHCRYGHLYEEQSFTLYRGTRRCKACAIRWREEAYERKVLREKAK
jgi:hypothetical protein